MNLSSRLKKIEKAMEEHTQDSRLRIVIQKDGMSGEDALKNAGIEPDDDEGLIVIIKEFV